MDKARVGDWGRKVALSPILPFAALSTFLLFVHEPWRDEAEVWLIVRDSRSLNEFFRYMSYEGTPALWHLLLAPLAKAGLPFMAGRILHAAIATAGVAAIWFFSPFRPWERWLLAFGYYLAYEYDAIARSYALLALMLWSAAAMEERRHRHPVQYAVVLSLLANTALHGLLIASVLGGRHAIEVLRGLRDHPWTRGLTAAIGVLVAGFGLSVLLLLPAPDLDPVVKTWYGISHPRSEFWNIVNSIIVGLVPIPAAKHVFWDSAVLFEMRGAYKAMVACILYAAAIWSFRADRRGRALFLLFLVLFEALFFLKYYGNNHHAGILFLCFVFCHWIARLPVQHPRPSPEPLVAQRPARNAFASLAAWFFPLVLVLQALGAAAAIERDASGTFSGAPALSSYLREHHLVDGKTLLATYHSQGAHGALADLPGVQVFMLETGRSSSVMSWSAQWRVANTHFTLQEALQKIDGARPGYSRVVLIETDNSLVGPLASPPPSAGDLARLTHLVTIGKDPVGSADERFDLYEVAPSAS
ncbi:MAG TPA: hypothetical protein VM286_07730 [Candidatus Thermoplasmatota archaeon]|nr:hypothetical protein [Candidatus Thermoplasmatota archaeon]